MNELHINITAVKGGYFMRAQDDSNSFCQSEVFNTKSKLIRSIKQTLSIVDKSSADEQEPEALREPEVLPGPPRY